MKHKQSITLNVPDAFETNWSISSLYGVLSVNVVTCNQVRIYFDARRVDPETIEVATGGTVVEEL